MDVAERNQLVEQHLPLVRQVARRLCSKWRKQRHYQDAVQDGCLGLMDAVAKYEPAKGPFPRYAKLRIHGAIVDALRILEHSRKRTLDRMSQTQRSAVRPASLNAVASLMCCTPERITADHRTDNRPDYLAENRDEVAVALKGFDKSARIVAVEYFLNQKTARETGRSMGLTESAVCMIIKRKIRDRRKAT